MKKILLFCGALLWLAAACNQDLDTWSGRDTAYIDASTEQTHVSFVYMDSEVEEYTVYIFVRFMGDVVSHERRIKVRIGESDATAGLDYTPLDESYAVEAGRTYGVIPIVLLRNGSLLEQEKYLVLELVGNSDFELNYLEDRPGSSNTVVSKLRYRITFTDMMNEPPRTWRIPQFGAFSPEKFKVICDVMEIPREKFNDAVYLTVGRANFIANYMKQYFIRMQEAGTPVFERDGVTLMRMGDNI